MLTTCLRPTVMRGNALLFMRMRALSRPNPDSAAISSQSRKLFPRVSLIRFTSALINCSILISAKTDFVPHGPSELHADVPPANILQVRHAVFICMYLLAAILYTVMQNAARRRRVIIQWITVH